jgi:hypothetical protein
LNHRAELARPEAERHLAETKHFLTLNRVAYVEAPVLVALSVLAARDSV